MSRHATQQVVTRILALSVLLGATGHLASAQPCAHLLLWNCLYLGSGPSWDGWDRIHDGIKAVTDNLIIWDHAKMDFAGGFVEPRFGPQLELVAEVPPTDGITVEWIEAIQGLDSSPNEIVFASRNVGADCGGGTPVSAWKLILDPDTGELVDLSLKQHLTLIQNVRRSLFEASDGTLFTGGGWCLYKPPYYSIDGGESWQPATQGNHPPNSNFSYAEFNGEVYLGTGYAPYHGQLWRWLGESSTDHWELLLDIAPPRNYVDAMAAYDGRLYVGSVFYGYGCGGCEDTVPVWVSTDGNTFNATTGIPSCYSVLDLLVVGDDLVAHVAECGTADYYIYRWRTDLSAWEEVAPYDLGPSGLRLVSHEGAIYSYGQAPGDPAAGIYESADLGQTWQQLAALEDPDASALHIHGDSLYIGTGRDANDIAYIYRMRLEEVLALDIKPGSCPNPFNRKSRGVLPVAVLGTMDFDVTTIDVSTVRLARADGVGGEVAPLEGPSGPHSVVEDVATPFEGELCDCHDLGADGYVDLSMKFSSRDVVAALELEDVPGGTELELVVSGSLLDGTAFAAHDCIVLRPNR